MVLDATDPKYSHGHRNVCFFGLNFYLTSYRLRVLRVRRRIYTALLRSVTTSSLQLSKTKVSRILTHVELSNILVHQDNIPYDVMLRSPGMGYQRVDAGGLHGVHSACIRNGVSCFACLPIILVLTTYVSTDKIMSEIEVKIPRMSRWQFWKHLTQDL